MSKKTTNTKTKGTKSNRGKNLVDIIPVKAGKKSARGTTTYASYSDGYKVGGGLTLCDPLTQIAKRIQAFFADDPDVITTYKINNNVDLEPPKYDKDGKDGKPGQDHLAELCIYVQSGQSVEDTTKADCISNYIRHRHVLPEYTFDGVLIRNHILNVRVFAVGAVDPHDTTQTERISECAFPTDEKAQCDGKKRAFKWECLRRAFYNNPSIADMTECTALTGTKWYFIECRRDPLTFQEDNLTNFNGFKSELVESILPLVFVFNGDFQISTKAQSSDKTLRYAFTW